MNEEVKVESENYASKFNILYEDNHIIVVLKEQMVACCPDESKDENLLDMIKEYVKITYNKPGNVYVGLVHRLDRPTGGVMVYAKTSKAAGRLGEGMQAAHASRNAIKYSKNPPILGFEVVPFDKFYK